jgi:polyferredoxin
MLSFVDFYHLISREWVKVGLYLQFVPSLFSAFSWAGLASAGFIVVLLLTVLFGRVYCSFICPLGVFQDVISFFTRKMQKKHRYKYAKPSNWIRYSILGLTIISVLSGYFVVLYLVEPYSVFGRMASDIFRPACMLINNGIAWVLMKFNIFVVIPVQIKYVALSVALFPIFMLALVVMLSILRGRLYCNSICPVGSFLGLLSKISVFRPVINKTSCTQCAQCAFVCKAQCIDVKNQIVDESRCVGCFNCLNVCANSSVKYKLFLKKRHKGQQPETDTSKRKFIVSSILLTGVFAGFSKKIIASENSDEEGKSLVKNDKKNVCSPPGSVSHDHFNKYCTACHLCVTGCPNKVLQPSMFEYGVTGMLQPYLDPRKGFCNFDCTHCGEVCPTGAIIPLTHEEKITTQMGIAHFQIKNCIVYLDETDCGSCAEHCPTQAVHMVDYKDGLFIPEVTTNICVGCGACEYACPAKPNKAIFVDGNLVHQIAQRPQTKKVEDKEIEEFPF